MKAMRLSAATALIVTNLLGCGTKQNERAAAPQPNQSTGVAAKTIQADAAHDAAIEAEYNQMPANVILRVKKDAAGNEIQGSAEMATLDAAVKEDKIEDSFLAGSLVSESKNADSLDGDSSAQSWYGWNNWDNADYNNQTTINYSNINYGNQYDSANFGGGYGYGNNGNPGNAGWNQGGGNGLNQGNGSNQFSNGWNNYGSYYYNNFRPLYGSQQYRGSWYQYGRPNCYNYGNYNYYWYPRPSCSGWNGCGGVQQQGFGF